MALDLETKLNLPKSIQTEAYSALPINGQNGVCISFYHPDQLDLESLKYAAQLKEESEINSFYAADLGCSPYFPQAIRFAQLGMRVDAFDIENPIPEYPAVNHELGHKINYIKTNLKLDLNPSKHQYSIVYANRFISHLTFSEARNLLEHFINYVKTQCRFYLSFDSLELYGEDCYSDYKKPVEQRYSKVVGELFAKHRLTGDLCLYTRDDIYNKLLKNLPIEIIDEFAGSLSIKIIFSKI